MAKKLHFSAFPTKNTHVKNVLEKHGGLSLNLAPANQHFSELPDPSADYKISLGPRPLNLF